MDAALHFEVDGAGDGPRADGLVDYGAAAQAMKRQLAVHVAGCAVVGNAEPSSAAEAEQHLPTAFDMLVSWLCRCVAIGGIPTSAVSSDCCHLG